MVEVHFTFDRAAKGPDHKISLTPDELEKLVRSVRDLETALGREDKVLGEHVQQMRESFTNSIVSRREIEKGEVFCRDNLALKKPGTGLSPDKLTLVIGKKSNKHLESNTLIELDDIE